MMEVSGRIGPFRCPRSGFAKGLDKRSLVFACFPRELFGTWMTDSFKQADGGSEAFIGPAIAPNGLHLALVVGGNSRRHDASDAAMIGDSASVANEFARLEDGWCPIVNKRTIV